ncbi:DUF2850 domain-containing protein [Vibrio sp.]|uniref:DUF2850 domain-containing protein n=1 Tax=Vibrio sp. TaxID=678 RepID=UPI003D13EC5D
MLNKPALKIIIPTLFCVLAVGFSALLYFSYHDYVNPKHVYGNWVEIGAPTYNTEVITLDKSGVFRNSRMVATQFGFDGKMVTIETGQGKSVYKMAGTIDSPQLKRIEPYTPMQRFIKQGYEHTVDMDGEGIAKTRRVALSDHFSED